MQSTNFTPEQWMERLNDLKSRAYIGSNKGLDSKMNDNKVADENLNMNNQISQRGLLKKEVIFLVLFIQMPVTNSKFIFQQPSEIQPNRLESLQARLAQIKQRQNT